jgi:hypothetical protein
VTVGRQQSVSIDIDKSKRVNLAKRKISQQRARAGKKEADGKKELECAQPHE